MKRIIECLRAITAILKGTAIIIEDRGDNCRTFVGSSISERRFKVLVVNQLITQQ